MKKLLGLVAVALVLAFASVSVGWAAPAHNHHQQKYPGKEQPKKAVKKPGDSVRHPPAGKPNIKAPPPVQRQHPRNNDRHVKAPGEATVKAPARDNRSHINPDSYRPHKAAADRIKPHGNYDRHDRPRFEPRSGHRHPPAHPGAYRHHSRYHYWPDNDRWHHHFRDWSWFISHRVLNIGVVYADAARAHEVYVHYEPQDGNYLYLLESRYGPCTYRERHYRYGDYGWSYYWFSAENVIAFFVRDDGYSRAFIWRRAEAEDRALSLGLLTRDLQLYYSSYAADMPPELAADYARDILWPTVDDEV